MLINTPIDSIIFNNNQVFVKRDDLLHPEFSGNKARKFAYFLENDFPLITKLVGYGSAQANSLYSMSALAKLKGWEFDFYVDHIASHIFTAHKGNYAAAIKNGANIIDLSKQADRAGRHCFNYIEEVVLPENDHIIFVPEGGRCEYAKYGVHRLAAEIAQWCTDKSLHQLSVFLPAGTGTTAVFLSEYFKRYHPYISVFTCAAVGDNNYLTSQFSQLVPQTFFHPNIVSLPKKFHFGKLYKAFYDMWKLLSDSGIEFELLYDPLGWMAVEQLINEGHQSPILYIHQGGLLGNETMLPRYQRKYG